MVQTNNLESFLADFDPGPAIFSWVTLGKFHWHREPKLPQELLEH
jgi:hypothetical protein